MNRPFLSVVILLLWIISLVAYLLMTQYPGQSVQLHKQGATLKAPNNSYPSENDVEKRMKVGERKIIPEVIEGIQNKEP